MEFIENFLIPVLMLLFTGMFIFFLFAFIVEAYMTIHILEWLLNQFLSSKKENK